MVKSEALRVLVDMFILMSRDSLGIRKKILGTGPTSGFNPTKVSLTAQWTHHIPALLEHSIKPTWKIKRKCSHKISSKSMESFWKKYEKYFLAGSSHSRWDYWWSVPHWFYFLLLELLNCFREKERLTEGVCVFKVSLWEQSLCN